MSELNVLVAGAGLGGLCLAQSLRRNGVAVEVYERDQSPWDRPQGYRLHIDADGVTALHQSLPPDLYDLFEAIAMKPLPFTTIVDTNLVVLNRRPSDDHGGTQGRLAGGLPSHVNVDRAILRQILLTDLTNVVHFGKRLTEYQDDGQGVTETFGDGTRARGDLLVGADGIRSSVRQQRLPAAVTQGTGLRAIYGRVPLETAFACVPEQVLADVFTVAIDARKLFLGLGPVVFPTRPEAAAAQIATRAELRPQGDYVACIIGGRTELFGHDDDRLLALSSPELQQVFLELMRDWPERARTIPAHGDPESFFFVEMRTSVPCELPPPANVTLLGDAIHAMTPTLGRGANVALRDGAMLGRFLGEATRGRHTLPDALGAYEAAMTLYGFSVVQDSAALGARLIGQRALPEGLDGRLTRGLEPVSIFLPDTR